MSWHLGLVLLSIGVTVALSAAAMQQFLASAPDDPQEHRDRPPLFWRVCWPFVVAMAFRLPGAESTRRRFATVERLRRGGLDFALTAEEFLAGRLIAAGLGGAVALFIAEPWRSGSWWPVPIAAGVAFLLPELWLRDRIERRRREILRHLPFFIDLITLAVESGLNLTSALAQAVEKGPAGVLLGELGRVMRDLRGGRSRAESLRTLAERLSIPAVSSLVSVLITADRQGASMAPVLKAQSEQRRNERFLRAEKIAMEAPVKMLLPLVAFVFPCTFLVLLYPIVVKMMSEGWMR